jgi:hypothetical protein
MAMSEMERMRAVRVNHCFQFPLEALGRMEALVEGLEFDDLRKLMYRRALLQQPVSALAQLPFSLRHFAALLSPSGRDGSESIGNRGYSLAASKTRCMAYTAQTNGTQNPTTANPSKGTISVVLVVLSKQLCQKGQGVVANSHGTNARVKYREISVPSVILRSSSFVFLRPLTHCQHRCHCRGHPLE